MKLGDFQLRRISDGDIWLDGGAMFGLVPKPLWQKKMPSDENNRIRLGLNCLLVQNGKHNILLDTGCGQKYTDRQRQIYGLESQTGILHVLGHFGLAAEDIDLVINSHLHFDHCGGNTSWKGSDLVPTFSKARYLIRRREYEDACHPDERSRATYFAHNWRPLEEYGLLELVDEDGEVAPGVSLIATPGHTPGHQSVKIESGGHTVFYIADLCPTSAHVPMAWTMGFDECPRTTLETRKRIYPLALQERWLLFLEHDPEIYSGYLACDRGRYELEPVAWTDDG